MMYVQDQYHSFISKINLRRPKKKQWVCMCEHTNYINIDTDVDIIYV